MWTTRRQAEKALEGPLRPVAGLLDEAFAMIDETIARLQEINPPFGTASALVLVKGRNLAMGCYSLSLDALAQEAGALFRPLIEACELLVYLGRDPTRVNEIVEDRLPKAGKIAARIGGQLKPVRDHLSAHASHLSVSEESMAIWLSGPKEEFRLSSPSIWKFFGRTCKRFSVLPYGSWPEA
jgi:hypothetical protein